MEKMQLGSPTSPGQNTYLPNFLMGIENTNSPNLDRSPQPRLFSGQDVAVGVNQTNSGPPTTALFDYSVHTPKKAPQQQSQSTYQSFMDSSGFNQSRIMSPILNLTCNEYDNSSSKNATFQTSVSPPVNGFHNFWITIFGFPPSAIDKVLSHFSQCGSILEKVCSCGNWMHLKFSGRIECDKALLFNGKIICNNLMIGVIRCTDDSILDKENRPYNRDASRIRSLTDAARQETEVILSPNAPKRTTGMINKTLDLFFGW